MGASFSVQLSDSQKAALTKKAIAAGINPSGGDLPKELGVSLRFVVDGNEVVFTILSKPFLVTDALIETHVRQFLSSQE